MKFIVVRTRNIYPSKQCREEYITAPDKTQRQRDTFIGAMRLTVVIGQIFGLNPVLGVFETDASKLRYSFFSMRCLYTCLSIIGQILYTISAVVKLFNNHDTNLSSTTSVIFFYCTNSTTTILFLRLATQWPKLCQHISKIEQSDPNAITSTSIVKKCNVSCILILTLATLEHLLSVLSGLAVVMACQPETGLYTAFALRNFSSVWVFLDYHPLIAVICQLVSVQLTVTWNFTDLFVICLSWYLESRITQINVRLNSMRGKHASASFWRTMREDYSKATNLVRKVDDVIGGIVLISFANNVCSICMQLLHVLDHGFHVESVCGKSAEEMPIMHGFEQVIYFAYSFIFLLSRAIAVSLILSRVHTASKKTAYALYEVPSSAYCIEVQRFIDQAHGDTVALSGLKFFNIKRGLVLAVTGTIVTYELVCMQLS